MADADDNDVTHVITNTEIRTINASLRNETTDFSATLESTHTDIQIAAKLPKGTMVGGHAIGRPIGWGGAGIVYTAQQKSTRRRVAIKVLNLEPSECPEIVRQVLDDVRAVSLLQHPNIIVIHDCGQLSDGRPYLVMELLAGMTLAELIKIHGTLSLLEAVELLDPICAALEAAHLTRITHRNLKASNVMIVDSGDTRIVKLVDFGIAKLLPPDAAPSRNIGRLIGSPEVMAPEQILGHPVDARADVYGLGALLFQLLTGVPPFSGPDDIALLQAQVFSSPPRPSDLASISPPVEAVLLRSLEKEAESRYDSIAAFRHALQEAMKPRRQPTASRGTVRAMAIFVEGRVPVGNFDETVDDSLLRDLTLFLDITEDALQDAAFQIVTNTYNGVLGVKLLSAHPQGDIDDRAHALTVAENIYDDLVHQPGMSQRLQVCVCIHADLADVAPTAEGYAVTGGGIVDLKMWAPRNQLTGVYATPDMVRGLPGGIPTQSSAGGYVRLVP